MTEVLSCVRQLKHRIFSRLNISQIWKPLHELSVHASYSPQSFPKLSRSMCSFLRCNNVLENDL